MENNIAKFVKDTRGKLGLTQEQLAQKLGVKRATVGHYETGIIKPSTDVYIRLQELEKEAA